MKRFSAPIYIEFLVEGDNNPDEIVALIADEIDSVIKGVLCAYPGDVEEIPGDTK